MSVGLKSTSDSSQHPVWAHRKEDACSPHIDPPLGGHLADTSTFKAVLNCMSRIIGTGLPDLHLHFSSCKACNPLALHLHCGTTCKERGCGTKDCTNRWPTFQVLHSEERG
jgi:hypothetical protein